MSLFPSSPTPVLGPRAGSGMRVATQAQPALVGEKQLFFN